MNGEGAKPKTYPVAALAYLGFIVTGIVFLYVEPYNQDDFVRFHARQSIGFTVAWLGVLIVFAVFESVPPLRALLTIIRDLVNLGLALFWLFLMYKAYSGERYRIPELSNLIDQVVPPTV